MENSSYLSPAKPALSVILTFHGIGEPRRTLDPGEDEVWLTRERFEQILDCIADQPQVEITFDDGNASDLDYALPAMQERGLSGTFFVLAGRMGESGALGGADLRKMMDAGMEIGSHGMAHHPWRRLDVRAAELELVAAKAQLEEWVNRPVTKAACPFGAYDRRALALAKRAGFQAVYTSDGGLAERDRWLRVRNTIRANDTPATVSKLLQMHRGNPRHWTREAKTLIKRLR